AEACLAPVSDRYLAVLPPKMVAEHIRLARKRGDRPAAIAAHAPPAQGTTAHLSTAPRRSRAPARDPPTTAGSPATLRPSSPPPPASPAQPASPSAARRPTRAPPTP